MTDYKINKLTKGQSNWHLPYNALIDQLSADAAALQVQINSNNNGLQSEIDSNKATLQANIDSNNTTLQAQIDNNLALIDSINAFLEQNSTFDAGINYFDFAKASRLTRDTMFGIKIF